MNITEALTYIHSVCWKGSIPGLSRTQELLHRMGNPEKRLKFVHIAGTNGKGSTAAMIASILRKAGYCTGLYTSPFLFRFNERMNVNGVDIALRLQCVRDELLTGAMLFSAVFLLNEPYTCAHHHLGRILYGVLVGAITMGFRYYGVYETGVCFALLTVNSISGWMDRTESRLYQLMHRPAAGKEGAE